MAIYGDYLNLLTGEQNIQDQQFNNALKVAEIQRINNQVALDAQTRKIAQAYQLAQDNQQANANGAPVAPPTPPQGVDASPQLQPIQSQITQAMQDYQFRSNFAAAIRAQGGDVKMAEKYDDDARDSLRLAQEGQLRLLQERKNVIQQAGAIAGNANADNFPQVKQQLDTLMPGWDQKLDVDISPLEGAATVWGPRTQTAMNTIAQSALTRYQQLEDAHNQAEEKLRAQTNANTAAEYASRDDARQAREQAARDNLDLRERNFDLKQQLAAKGKPSAAKEPTASEANAQAPVLQDALGVDPKSAKAAAYDYIRYRNQQVAQGMDPQQADDSAMAFVKSRVQPGQTYDAAPWYMPKDIKTKPGTYGKSPNAQSLPVTQDQSSDATLMKSLAAAGVSAQVKQGKVTGDASGNPVQVSNDQQFSLLPSGTVFVGPDGVKRRKP